MIDGTTAEERLVAFLAEECFIDNPNADESLFQSGRLDSLDFIDLMGFLKSEGINEERLKTLDFASVDCITAILRLIKNIQ